ncbi:ABC transporter permease [Bacteroidota bacterium]
MLRNYLTIAFRVLWNNKVFSIINIFGLAVGMAAALILFQYVWFEQSYDAFHEKADHIYRSNLHVTVGETELYRKTISSGAGPLMKEELPEVLDYVRFFKHSIKFSACIITYQPEYGSIRQFNENQEKIYFADATVFNMFDFPLLKGSPDDVLKEPNTVALSETTALRYFGDQDPIGKIIHMEDWVNVEKMNFMVTGVFKDIPVNSHIQFDILISFATEKARNPDKDYDNWWGRWAFDTYVLLKEGTNPKEVEVRSLPFIEKRMEKELEGWRATLGENMEAKFPLQPIRDIHLNPIINNAKKSDVEKLYLLTLIGIMIIFIACVNYINLSTAKAAQRSREVGMRKVMGANRHQLIFQFLAESMIINVMAVIIALTIVQVIAPSFNQLVQKEIITYEMFDLKFVGLISFILVGCVLVSGFYPAIILSSFQPIKSLKGQLNNSVTAFSLKNILIIFQFSASVILISSVYTLSRQLSFMNKIDLGFTKDQILTLRVPSQNALIQRMETFKKELIKKPEVLNVSNSTKIPGTHPGAKGFSRVHQSESDQIKADRGYGFFAIDDGYLNTFEIELLKGRNFGTNENLDPDAVLINEVAMKNLGFENSDEAVNAEILYRGNVRLRVIGVVKDYYHQAPKWGNDPIVMQNRGHADELPELKWRVWPGKYLSLKIRSQDMPETIKSIQAEWEKTFPEAPFDYFFLDENYNIQYGQDQQEARIFGIFSILAVIIACMGLFGITLYATLRRTKEIGIRKVMGAPVTNILQLLTKESVVLLIISSVIAVPIAYWFVNNQLEEYANRIKITPWLFTVPVLIVILISLLTVAYQTVKTALANPVKSLRYE